MPDASYTNTTKPMKRCLSILAPLLFPPLAMLHAAAPPKPAAKPNLLIIHTDEHNFRTLGCYRDQLPKEQAFVWGDGVKVDTPNIDSLARRGALCDRFYATSPVCTPSRASFLTGCYPQNTGAPVNNMTLRDDLLTFAEVLRRDGYTTGYAGKLHVDGPAKPGWQPKRDLGFADHRYMFNRGHWKNLEDTAKGPAVKGGDTYKIGGADAKSFTTDFLADKTVEFIRANKNRPFCFMLSIPDPHGPNTVRPPYDTMFANLQFQRPATSGGKGAFENMPRYFGMVKCIDDNVGKILAALESAGLSDSTIVVFTSDHGDMCGEHGLTNKGVPFEASARIPFVISYPGIIKPGTVIHEALATVDFKPTVLGLLGISPDNRDEGRDASALLRTGKPPANWQDMTFSRNAGGQWLMAVSSRCKFIVYADADPALFDLERDPFEMHNLFSTPAMRETVREMARSLTGYAKRYKEPTADKPAIRADLAWAAEGTGPYTPPKRVPAGKGSRANGK